MKKPLDEDSDKNSVKNSKKTRNNSNKLQNYTYSDTEQEIYASFAKAKRFGEFVQQRRVELGLTQSRFAELVGYSPAMISRLEKGDRAPDMHLLITKFALHLRLQHSAHAVQKLFDLGIAEHKRQYLDKPEPSGSEQSSSVRLNMLGQFKIYSTLSEIVEMPPKTPLLLLFLILQHHRSVSYTRAADALWPELTNVRAMINLRDLLFDAHEKLGDKAFAQILDNKNNTLRWCGDEKSCDLFEFEHFVRLAQVAKTQNNFLAHCNNINQAVALYGGELLSDYSAEWLGNERARLNGLYTHALDELIQCRMRERNFSEAQILINKRIKSDPLYEPSYVNLMRVCALLGDRVGVMRAYQACSAMLKRELGIAPGPLTQAAYERSLSIDPERLCEVPEQPNDILGREEALVWIDENLARNTCRMITLVGAGGVGKTRLAIAAATQQTGRFDHGVFYVPLSELTNADDLPNAVAQVLRFSPAGDAPLQTQLLHYLRNKHMLLVLDNVEQLVNAATFINKLLQDTLEIKLLITTRLPLHLRWEHIFLVKGLSYPDQPTNDLMQFPAVALFVQTARRTGVMVDPEDAPAIIEICRFTEGIPLALELVAAQTRTRRCADIAHTLAQIAAHTNDSTVPFENAGDVTWLDLPIRQRSLRAVFESTWQLLTTDEQNAFIKLSLARGGVNKEAASHILNLSARATGKMLDALVMKNLLQTNANGRYSLHGVSRVYGLAKLNASPEQLCLTQMAYGKYYLGMLARFAEKIEGPEESHVLKLIEEDFENIMVAWEWVSRAYGEWGAQLGTTTCIQISSHSKSLWQMLIHACMPLIWFCLTQSRLRNGQNAINIARTNIDFDKLGNLSAMLKSRNDELEAIFSVAQGVLHYEQGDFAKTRTIFRQLLTMVSAQLQKIEEELSAGKVSVAMSNARIRWQNALVRRYDYLARAEMWLGNMPESIRLLKEGIAISQQNQISYWASSMIEQLGNMALLTRDIPAMTGYFEQAQQLADKTGNLFRMTAAKRSMSIAHYAQGQFNVAYDHFNEAQTVAKTQRWHRLACECLSLMGLAAWSQGKFELAEQHLVEAGAFAKDIGLKRQWGWTEIYRGLVLIDMGYDEQAIGVCQAGIALAESCGAIHNVLDGLMHLGHILTLARKPDVAIEQLQRALALDIKYGLNWIQDSAYFCLARAYLFEGDVTKAEYYLKLSLDELMPSKGFMSNRLMAWLVAGEYFLAQGNLAEAQDYFEKVIAIASSGNGLRYVYSALGGCARCANAAGKREMASELAIEIMAHTATPLFVRAQLSQALSS
jgi:predicted ATPase/transcriptional regulator with XRE-family HTH domain